VFWSHICNHFIIAVSQNSYNTSDRPQCFCVSVKTCFALAVWIGCTMLCYLILTYTKQPFLSAELLNATDFIVVTCHCCLKFIALFAHPTHYETHLLALFLASALNHHKTVTWWPVCYQRKWYELSLLLYKLLSWDWCLILFDVRCLLFLFLFFLSIFVFVCLFIGK